jgi:predicted DCC family thiol-disulfide oxidoreductase YuxK
MTDVLFDGHCPSCSRWASWILKRDRRKVFELIPQASDAGAAILVDLPPHLLEVDSLFVRDGSGWHTRSSAVCRILWGLGIHWRISGLILFIVPRPIRNFGYDFIARRRHRSAPTDS